MKRATLWKRLALFALVSSLAWCVRSDDDRDAVQRRDAMARKGAVRAWPARDWSLAYEYRTRHYKVVSNTAPVVCEYIGLMMEKAYAAYADIFQYTGSMPEFPIHAYATMEEFRMVAEEYGFGTRDVSGFYTSRNGGAIFLPYLMTGAEHPITVLFHEGAHQFVHKAIDMPVPWKYEASFDEGTRRLPSTPIWLNEGLACYLETAQYDGTDLELGRVNRQRLLHLQHLLKNGEAPTLEETVSRPYGVAFDARHYAVAWGLVWYLRHDSDVVARDGRRRALNRYVEAVKLGFFDDPDDEFASVFLEDDAPRKDAGPFWRAYIGRRSLEVFRERIVGGEDLARWEATWQAWILRREARYAFGGTKRGEAVFNEGNLRLGQ